MSTGVGGAGSGYGAVDSLAAIGPFSTAGVTRPTLTHSLRQSCNELINHQTIQPCGRGGNGVTGSKMDYLGSRDSWH